MLLVFFLSIVSFAQTLSLKEAFIKSKAQTEVIKRAQLNIEQAEENKSQTVGSVLPLVTLRANYQQLDPPDTGGAPRGLVRTSQYGSSINVTQPLFRGLKEYSAYRQAKSNIHLQQFQKEADQVNLYLSLVNAYFNVQLAKKDLDNLKNLEEYSQQRVKEIQERVRIGRSRKGELFQAQAQLANSQALVIDAEALMTENLAHLNFFLGESKQVKWDLVEEKIPLKIEPIDFYLAKVNDRPELKVRLAEANVAHESIIQARGDHFPTLDAFGNYYLKRTGVLESSTWDAGLTFSMPLFQGGTVNSNIQEAVSIKNEALLNQQETKRSLERDITILYENFTRSVKQLSSLENALKKSEETYRENLKDYRFGLTTNLEVLQSLNNFVETKRSYDRLQNQTLFTMKNLEAQTGDLP